MRVPASQWMVGIAAAVCLTTACDSAKPVEEIPPGTDVAIQLKDGQRVTGALLKVSPNAVAVSHNPGGTRVVVDRREIASVGSGGAAKTPAVRTVAVPAGTRIEARLDTAVGSDTSAVGSAVRATLETPLIVGGAMIAPAGSTLLGEVAAAKPAGRVQGRAELAVRFTRLRTGGITYDVPAETLRWIAKSTKTQDALAIGAGAGAGALIGGLAGGKKGAAVGTAIGAGGGTAIALSTKGHEIRLDNHERLIVVTASEWSVGIATRSS